MAEDLNIDADPFLQVLTEALRSGPGSAEWNDAVSRLKAGGIPDSDQYAALVAAREHLESGKSYRSIRAGAGFTRKLEAQIHAVAVADGSRTRSPLSASFATYVGVALLVGVFAVLIYHLSGSATEDVSGTLFNTVLSAKMDGPLSPGWRIIGSLPVDPAKGLLPGPNRSDTDYLGGGLVVTSAINATDLFAVEATFRFQHVNGNLIPQVFVADSSDFNSAQAVSQHELAWLVRNGQGQVLLPNGELAGTPTRIADNSTVTVQVRVGKVQAMVLVNGVVVWSGASQLTDQPRYPGVRLLRRGSAKPDIVTVSNLKILE